MPAGSTIRTSLVVFSGYDIPAQPHAASGADQIA
jgi:hypothetical protein